MRHDIKQYVGIPLNTKIEAPISRHPCLPDVLGLIILLGPQRGMAKIVCKQCCTTVKGLLNRAGSALVAATKALGIMEAHDRIAVGDYVRFFGVFVLSRDLPMALTESKGP
jgi:hypothetical protein